MKLFFCETFDDGTVGGSHSCMYNLIRHLDRDEFQCTVGFYGDNIYVEKYRSFGIEVVVLPFGKPLSDGNPIARKVLNWYNQSYKAGKILEDFLGKRRFDLVVLNNSIFVSLLFVRVCRKLAIPLVVYERGIGFFLKKHTRASKHIQASIPVSNAVKEFLLRSGFRTERIEMIYDGIDPSAMAIPGAPERVKEGLGIPPNSRLIGIVGNLRPWKGQKYFVEGFIRLARDHADLYGLVVGGWSEEDRGYQASLADAVETAGLSKRVIFLGFRRDVPDILSALDVFVHASIKPEPFGMVLLEAMASRVPVVATNMGGPVEILDRGRCGILVPPKDGKAIADAANRYLRDEEFRTRMVGLAAERIEAQFRIGTTVARTSELFRTLSAH